MGACEVVGGGPLDGDTEDPTICTECGEGEIMDLVQEVYVDGFLTQVHVYCHDETDNKFHYAGIFDIAHMTADDLDDAIEEYFGGCSDEDD